MRATTIVIGLILIATGIWIVLGHGSYESTETVLQIGPAALKATQQKALPQWLGIASLVVGGVLCVGGFLGGRRK